MFDIMKKVQQMQEKMSEAQDALAGEEVSGVSGGGLVTVVMNCKGELRGVKIDPSLLKQSEAEILEDLIVAAHQDAKTKAETHAQEKMKEITGDLPIPPGMNLFS